MGDDLNVHVMRIEDDDGVTWEARQFVGFGMSVGYSEAMSGVTFKNLETGEELRGQAKGIGKASEQEFQASLKEAKRLNRLEHPGEHGR